MTVKKWKPKWTHDSGQTQTWFQMPNECCLFSWPREHKNRGNQTWRRVHGQSWGRTGHLWPGCPKLENRSAISGRVIWQCLGWGSTSFARYQNPPESLQIIGTPMNLETAFWFWWGHRGITWLWVQPHGDKVDNPCLEAAWGYAPCFAEEKYQTDGPFTTATWMHFERCVLKLNE